MTVSNYNADPPSDDGAQTQDNKLTYSRIKENLFDPIKGGAEDMVSVSGIRNSSTRGVMSFLELIDASSFTLTADRIYIKSFLVPVPGTYSGMGIYIDTAMTGTARLKIFTVGSDGEPDEDVNQTGDIDVSSTGFQFANFDVTSTLDAKWYYVGLICDAGIDVKAIESERFASPLGKVNTGLWYGWVSYLYEDVSSGWSIFPTLSTLSEPTPNTTAPLILLK